MQETCTRQALCQNTVNCLVETSRTGDVLMVCFQSFIQRTMVKVPRYEFWNIRTYRVQFMKVICNVFNRPRSVSTWMNVHKCEKQLREFPRKVERAEWDWQQLKVRRAECFANKDRVAPLFVDKHLPPPCSFLVSCLFLSRRRAAPKPSTVSSWLCTRSSSQVSVKASRQASLHCTRACSWYLPTTRPLSTEVSERLTISQKATALYRLSVSSISAWRPLSSLSSSSSPVD